MLQEDGRGEAGSIPDRVLEILCGQLSIKPSKVEEDSLLKDHLGADSLDMIEMAINIEDEFGIDLPDEEFEELKTVRELIALVESLAVPPGDGGT